MSLILFLITYRPEWLEPISIDLDDDEVLHTFPVPGSGPILAFIFNVLKQFIDKSKLDTVKNWQRIVETFKYAYAKRTELGDQNFVEISDVSEFFNCASSVFFLNSKFFVVDCKFNVRSLRNVN